MLGLLLLWKRQILKAWYNPTGMAKQGWLHNMLQKCQQTSRTLSALTVLPLPPKDISICQSGIGRGQVSTGQEDQVCVVR